jgi:hypothetical protein
VALDERVGILLAVHELQRVGEGVLSVALGGVAPLAALAGHRPAADREPARDAEDRAEAEDEQQRHRAETIELCGAPALQAGDEPAVDGAEPVHEHLALLGARRRDGAGAAKPRDAHRLPGGLLPAHGGALRVVEQPVRLAVVGSGVPAQLVGDLVEPSRARAIGLEEGLATGEAVATRTGLLVEHRDEHLLRRPALPVGLRQRVALRAAEQPDAGGENGDRHHDEGMDGGAGGHLAPRHRT